MNDRLVIRQIAQYPRSEAVEAGYITLMQAGEAGAPYVSIAVEDLVATALAAGGRLNLNSGTGAIVFGPPGTSIYLNAIGGGFVFSAPVTVPALSANFVDAQSVTIGGVPVATVPQVVTAAENSVRSFNARQGDVLLELPDVLRAGGAPIQDAHFGGWITAPSVWDTRQNDDTVATTNWVHRAIHDTGVSSFNCRTGDVTLTVADINAATAAGPGYPTAPSPVLGDASSRIATTLFVDESLADLHLTISNEQLALLTSTYAPLASPQLTGIPSGPTANPGTSTGQLATTAFVMNAITASTTGVSSFNTRTGAVTLQAADISGAGGALLNSPAFVGGPTAPTPAPGTNNTVLATTAFVANAVTAATAGVSSFNTRTGAVTLSLADVTGTGVLANTALTGVPTAPTAAPGTSSTQLATTAFVAASGVTSFMSRTGAVTLTSADVSAAGGALNASPAFTGTPTAPTAAPGTNSTQLATTAFVTAALAATGVTSFNGRAGVVTLTLADVTGTGVLSNTALTGVPTAPTAAPATNTTQLATTAFVQAALAASGIAGWTLSLSGSQSVIAATGTVASLFTVSGATTPVSANQAITFQSHSQSPIVQVADNTSNSALVGNYLIFKNNVSGSPAIVTNGGSTGGIQLLPGGTGTIQAPTMAAGDNSTAVATTAFVTGVAAPVISAASSIMFATQSANYSIVSTSPATIPHDTIVFDTNSEYSTSSRQFTAKRAGYYRATLLTQMSSTAAAPIFYIQIWKNGAAFAYGTNIGTLASGNTAAVLLFACTIVHLNVGDYLSPIAQTTVQPATVYGGSQSTSQFQVQLLALG